MFEVLRRYTFTLTALAVLAASAAHANEYKAGDLTIGHTWTRATPAGAKTAGGFVKITNHGTETDRLVGGSAEMAGKVEVHEMGVENNIMRMRKLENGLEIKPGETVELKPGSYHLMFMGLEGSYKEGETVKGTVTFEKAGTVEVEFKVKAMGAKEAHGSDQKMEGHGGDANNVTYRIEGH